MNNNDISKKINHLKSIARFGKHQFMNLSKDAFIKIFGSGKNAVSFVAVKGVSEFDEITLSLYILNQEITANYSLETFQEELCKLMWNLKKENRDCSLTDWKKFIQVLNDSPDIIVKRLAPIYGVTMNQSTVTLGDFTIYKPSDIVGLLKKEYPKISLLKNHTLQLDDSYKIAITIKAKDIEKCNELADKAFYSFENVANFVTASFHKTSRIGIFNYSPSKSIMSLSLTQSKANTSTKNFEEFHTVAIDNPLFQNDEFGNSTIWEWITSEKNTFQQKIMDSIEWAGKALVESDDSKALLQYIIAIEALLQYNEGQFIVPSIVSQLTDMIAFLLGKSYKQRLSFASYVKELYKIRSSITHSGKGNISEISLHTAHVLIKKIIRTIITTEPYKNFKTKNELCKYLSDLKYGAHEKESATH